MGERDFGARLNVRGVEQPLVAGLYADDTVLLDESEGMLQIVDEFERVCKRRKLKVNSGKRKLGKETEEEKNWNYEEKEEYGKEEKGRRGGGG